MPLPATIAGLEVAVEVMMPLAVISSILIRESPEKEMLLLAEFIVMSPLLLLITLELPPICNLLDGFWTPMPTLPLLFITKHF